MNDLDSLSVQEFFLPLLSSYYNLELVLTSIENFSRLDGDKNEERIPGLL